MEYIHPASIPSTKSELSIFSVPPTQVAIDSTYEVEYNPSATLEASQYHEINIPASDDFTDLSATMIHIKCEIVDGDGKPATGVTVVDNFGNSLFEQIDFVLNGINTVKSSNMYHYQAFIEKLLFKYPSNVDIGSDGTNSVERELYFNLHIPMCQQDRLLINNIPIQICFTRSKNAFSLMSTDAAKTFSVKIKKLSVHIKRVKLFPDAETGLLSSLEHNPAKYFIVRNEARAYSLNPGQRDYAIATFIVAYFQDG